MAVLLLIGGPLAGCHEPESPYSPAEQHNILKTVTATRINILPKFTQPASSSEGQVPDALKVVFQALNVYDEPTRLAGDVVFELHTFRPASSDPRGQLVQTWHYSLASKKAQRDVWNSQTQMYEMMLTVDISELPKTPKFVIVGRYTDVWAEHTEDVEVIDLTPLASQVRAAAQETPQSSE